MNIEIGAIAPGFALHDTEGRVWEAFGHDGPTAVIFTCNHCPYALAWHDRLLAVARDYADRGVRMLLICSNDGERHPHDSLEAMRARVAAEGPWPAPFLHDPTQGVAREYGATRTPEIFLLDDGGRLRYHGAPDGDHDDPSQNAAWLRAALDAVLAEDVVEDPMTAPVGCTIKWREG